MAFRRSKSQDLPQSDREASISGEIARRGLTGSAKIYFSTFHMQGFYYNKRYGLPELEVDEACDAYSIASIEIAKEAGKLRVEVCAGDLYPDNTSKITEHSDGYRWDTQVVSGFALHVESDSDVTIEDLEQATFLFFQNDDLRSCSEIAHCPLSLEPGRHVMSGQALHAARFDHAALDRALGDVRRRLLPRFERPPASPGPSGCGNRAAVTARTGVYMSMSRLATD